MGGFVTSRDQFVTLGQCGLVAAALYNRTYFNDDLAREVVHVWRSASKRGDTKTPKSRRSLELPNRAIAALTMPDRLRNGGQPARPGTIASRVLPLEPD